MKVEFKAHIVEPWRAEEIYKESRDYLEMIGGLASAIRESQLGPSEDFNVVLEIVKINPNGHQYETRVNNRDFRPVYVKTHELPSIKIPSQELLELKERRRELWKVLDDLSDLSEGYKIIMKDLGKVNNRITEIYEEELNG